jgi:hypothetical protein
MIFFSAAVAAIETNNKIGVIALMAGHYNISCQSSVVSRTVTPPDNW